MLGLGRIDDPTAELVQRDTIGLVRRLKQDEGMDKREEFSRGAQVTWFTRA